MSYPFPFASPRNAHPSIPADGRVPKLSPFRLAGTLRRMLKGRRLAVVDTHFPWQISGFRYRESLELQSLRPETLFFSLHALTDPFPARVLPLASFPRVAARAGVTDVYLVFLNLAVAFLGLADDPAAADVAGVPPFSARKVVDSLGIRVHVQLYPGGGLLPTTPPAILRAVAARCATVFTNVHEVEAEIPNASFVPMLVGASAYPFCARPVRDQLRLVFVGDDKSRKGLVTLIDAFNMLPEGFHLDIVGPNERHLRRLENARFRAHGWLGPTELRRLYESCDVFVSPATVETEDTLTRGTIDGFPTTAAAEAMASGCALVSSNPRREFRGLRPDLHYVDVPEREPEALVDALKMLQADREQLAALAARGAARVRAFATEIVVPQKLAAMGLPAPQQAANSLPAETRAGVERLLATLPQDTGGGSSLTKALLVGELIVTNGVHIAVEIGVYRGRFLLPVAFILRSLGRGPAIGIDPYSALHATQHDLAELHPNPEVVERWTSALDWDAVYEEVRRMIDEFDLGAACLIDRRPSRDAATDLPDEGIDLLHVDGNHDRRQVEEDLSLYLPKLRRGGIVVMDDLSWPSVAEAIAARGGELEQLCRVYEPGADDFAAYRVRSA